MKSALTVHILDTHSGESAEGVYVEVFRQNKDFNAPEKIVSDRTETSGRFGKPILSGEDFPQGHYTVRFHLGEYFILRGLSLPDPKFIDLVDIHIGVDGKSPYHLPLLITPWGYSVYRGT